MPEYALIRFNRACTNDDPISADGRLEKLIGYCNDFAGLGFARSYGEMPKKQRERFGYPDKGSEGNLSYREKGNTFVVTGSQLSTKRGLSEKDFARVKNVGFQGNKCTITYEGSRAPSSESMLHDAIYRSLPNVSAVFHGHDDDLAETFESLLTGGATPELRGVAYTEGKPAPGTKQTADTVLQSLAGGDEFAVIRGHGFVSVGGTMEDAVRNYVQGINSLKRFLTNSTRLTQKVC
jgi:ribulose-5-phosphate 4-epimerase/fuculose-1-phosphate aldolase